MEWELEEKSMIAKNTNSIARKDTTDLRYPLNPIFYPVDVE